MPERSQLVGVLSDLISTLDWAAKRSADYSERHFVKFGYLAWFIPLATVIDKVVGNPSYETLPIRLSVAALALPLIFHRSLASSFPNRFYLYFCFIATYAFPFCYATQKLMVALRASCC